MHWKEPEYNRSQIINAGRIIKDHSSSECEVAEALLVIDNWRAAHAYPMHVIYIHLRRMAKNDPEVVVAERLKRLNSITEKLRREPAMNLWTMQDLGGCRVIVPSLGEVNHYAEAYQNSRIRHIPKRSVDYIASPRLSGYRSLHLIYQYHSDKADTYNRNMLIEIQFRTKLQHLWATAVETMGLFTDQAIKAGQGSKDITRFFALVSSLFALEEKSPTVPQTSSSVKVLIHELALLNGKNHYLDMLRAIRVAVDHFDEKNSRKGGYYIMILNYETKRLNLRFFKFSKIDQAMKHYIQIEKTRSYSKVDAVLVSVSSFSALKIAYPNYFTDIGDFVKKIEQYLE